MGAGYPPSRDPARPLHHTGNVPTPDRATPDGVDLAKRALRVQVRARRVARVDREDVAAGLLAAGLAAGVLVAAARAGATVAAYAALPGEPDPGPLRAALRAAGARVLLPVVAGPGELRWAPDGPTRPGAPLPGGRRIEEPDVPADRLLTTAGLGLGRGDVVLAPALAAGRDGTRLGQGGGYYDRALAAVPARPDGPWVVAVVHDEEVLGTVPVGPRDRRVDALLTPTAWVDAVSAPRPA
jgi:5-formyltetrahydrofolate cyclo-ligase